MKVVWYVLDHTSPVVVEDVDDGSYISYMHTVRDDDHRRLAFRAEMCVKVIPSVPPSDTIIVFRAAGSLYYMRQGDMHTETADEVH